MPLSSSEQGIEGAFRITTIKHILPQKKPVDEDPDDDYVYKPVTGLITHQSGTVFEITFAEDKGGAVGKRDTIGVTAVHPFYSLTAGDWVAAGDLKVGEKVLAKSGAAIVISSRKREGIETVYNLEVKDWHNFLVGNEGVVVHNSCRNVIREIKKMSPKKLEKYIQEGWDFVIESGDDVVEFFNNRRFFEELMVEFRYLKEGMVSTNTIASNFKAIDAFKETSRAIVDGVTEITSNLAVSMKTTKVGEVTSWLSSNSSHLDDLVQGLSEGIRWSGHKIKYAKVRLDIYMPKDIYTPSKATQWKSYLKNLYPKIDFDISTLEKHIL